MNSHSFTLLLISIGIVLVSTKDNSITGSSAGVPEGPPECGKHAVYYWGYPNSELVCATESAVTLNIHKLNESGCLCNNDYCRNAAGECVSEGPRDIALKRQRLNELDLEYIRNHILQHQN